MREKFFAENIGYDEATPVKSPQDMMEEQQKLIDEMRRLQQRENDLQELSDPFLARDLVVGQGEHIQSDIIASDLEFERQKKLSAERAKKRTGRNLFKEEEKVNLVQEAMEYISRGWVFGLEKLMRFVPKEARLSDEFQNAVKRGLLKSLEESHPGNAIELKGLLASMEYLNDQEVRMAADMVYNRFLMAGQDEMAKKIKKEFLE